MIINRSGMNLWYMCNLILGAMTGSRFVERSLWSGKKQFFFCVCVWGGGGGGGGGQILKDNVAKLLFLEVKCKFWPVDWS